MLGEGLLPRALLVPHGAAVRTWAAQVPKAPELAVHGLDVGPYVMVWEHCGVCRYIHTHTHVDKYVI